MMVHVTLDSSHSKLLFARLPFFVFDAHRNNNTTTRTNFLSESSVAPVLKSSIDGFLVALHYLTPSTPSDAPRRVDKKVAQG